MTDLPLDLIGIQEATDKSSLAGDYLRHYARIFAPLRDAAFALVEIGVFNGSSLRMWEKYFTQARIVGVDIDPRCRASARDRVVIEIGSQNDPEFLHHLAATYGPLVIIDDGSHRSDDIIFTFERLFPALRAGGVYVIEDLHFHLREDTADRMRGDAPWRRTITSPRWRATIWVTSCIAETFQACAATCWTPSMRSKSSARRRCSTNARHPTRRRRCGECSPMCARRTTG